MKTTWNKLSLLFIIFWFSFGYFIIDQEKENVILFEKEYVGYSVLFLLLLLQWVVSLE